jgi:hypothetical protein
MGNDRITELGENNPGSYKTGSYNFFLQRVDSVINLGYSIDTGKVCQPNSMQAFCTGDWKIVQYVDPNGVENDQWELYCLTNDPVELINLVDYKTGEVRDDVIVPGMTTEELKQKNAYLKAQLAKVIGVQEIATLPTQIMLYQNLPNPFSLQTSIPFFIPENGPVRLTITDLTGKEVQILVSQTLTAGFHKFDFDARTLPSGIYLTKLIFNSEVVVKKIILMR